MGETFEDGNFARQNFGGVTLATPEGGYVLPEIPPKCPSRHDRIPSFYYHIQNCLCDCNYCMLEKASEK